jgi:Fe-S-cluster containining protein
MIEVGNTLVSLDVLEEYFLCDLKACHGACCVKGDSGAPLDENEIDYLEESILKITPFLRQEGIEVIEKQGVFIKDVEHERVTPLVNGKECAFVVFENGLAACGIEKAYEAGAITFQKPLSCHLYPIRIKSLKHYQALNYDRWDICKAAILLGKKEKLRVYQFLKQPLIRKFGEGWYKELCFVADEYLKSLEDPIH